MSLHLGNNFQLCNKTFDMSSFSLNITIGVMKTQKGFTVPKKSVGLTFMSRHESYKMMVVMQQHAV